METLYRKYRPLDFDTVVGQDSIVRTLRNQIKEGSIAHAYLFSGTRGISKNFNFSLTLQEALKEKLRVV